MTKDDKEFFDKVMIAALNGFVSQGENARWEVADASDIAERALKRRNVALQELGYQEPPQAETLPGIFGCAPIPKQAARGYKEHLHGGFGTVELGAEATGYIPTTTKDAEPSAITSHEVPSNSASSTETVVDPLSGEEYTKHGISVQKILSAVKAKKGRMMTANQIYMLAYEFDEPSTVNELRDIGRLLREHGYQIKRSGGKDLYQL